MPIKTWIVAGAIVLAAMAVLGSQAAWAQTQQQVNWCQGKDNPTPDLKISGCTAVIRSGKFTGNNLAIAFYNRGIAYANKKEYDRAIQDYDQAIKLEPKYASAFTNRGIIYANKKEYDRAIQDYDQAIKLDPNFTLAINNRAEAIAKKNK